MNLRIVTGWVGFAAVASFLAVSHPLPAFAADLPDKAADSSTPANHTYEVEAKRDFTYYNGAEADKKKHKLDLYLPKGKTDFPVVLFVHGGGWVFGDKNFFGVYEGVGKMFARHGIGAVVTNYRLSPGVKHPEPSKMWPALSPGRTSTLPNMAAGPTTFSYAATQRVVISCRSWLRTKAISKRKDYLRKT